jgi:hypothetical protein
MAELAQLIDNGLGDDPESVAVATSELRRRFDSIHYVRR